MRRLLVLLMLGLAVLAGCGDGETTESTDVVEGAETDTDSQDDSGEGESEVVSSIYDLPDECVDLLREQLMEMEVLVAPYDWDGSATIAQFEEISVEFDEIGERFDLEYAELGCDELEFEEAEEFAEVIAFAENEAPGIVPFLTYLESLVCLLYTSPSPRDS